MITTAKTPCPWGLYSSWEKQLSVIQSNHSVQWIRREGEREGGREEGRKEGCSEQRVHGFSLTGSLPGKKRSLSSFCWEEERPIITE